MTLWFAHSIWTTSGAWRKIRCTTCGIVSIRFIGSVYVKYAGKTTFDGNGNLRDSDAAVSEDLYVYDANAKNLPDENIAELVGKPYPLYNWCIAFYMRANLN